MRYLNFDVSSSVIGWSFVDISKGKILLDNIDYGFIKPPKGDEITSLYDLKNELSLFKKHRRKKNLHICIEEFPFFISGGKGFNSTARTITKLAIYTRVTALSLFEIFNIEPTFYKVATIRATMRKLCNNKDIKKEDIPSSVQDIIRRKTTNDYWTFPVFLNKNNKVKPETFDIADSFAVGFTHAYKLGDLE